MKRFMLCLAVLAGAAQAAIINPPHGGTNVVQVDHYFTNNIVTTNTVDRTPLWLATTQALTIAGGFDTNLAINVSNGATVFMTATDALATNEIITLDLPNLSSNLTALTVLVLDASTIITNVVVGDITTNATPTELTVTGAGVSACNGVYTYTNSEYGIYASPGDGFPAFVNSGSIYSVALIPTSPPFWQIQVPGVLDVYITTDSPTNAYTNGTGGSDPAPTATFTEFTYTYTTNGASSAVWTNAYSIVWPANVYSAGGAAMPLAPVAELNTNQFNLLWRGDHYEVAKPSNLAPVSP